MENWTDMATSKKLETLLRLSVLREKLAQQGMQEEASELDKAGETIEAGWSTGVFNLNIPSTRSGGGCTRGEIEPLLTSAMPVSPRLLSLWDDRAGATLRRSGLRVT